MTESPIYQWPAGRLLQAAREQKGLSKRDAAKRAGISESRWRQIECGWKKTNGELIETRPTSLNLVKCAKAVGASPDNILVAAGMKRAPATKATRDDLHAVVDTLTPSEVTAVLAFISGIQTEQATNLI
ncbi:helix-turn-helix transcriptional regulator [Corynebacterium ulcerans]|uniref:helix-turn-helix domain-containing protein n=1 Tax=Corynebacterium ulcerans TaxID=65058 RepID=UPI00254FCA6C|nr:helix-turn-helix transcriptional regulator [Corynebacterium ulcerans]MDK8889213.1 helix-turn-helix transcriptional regulator [Corynebacterium ulcerans]